jgi:hypothetical protein
LTAFLSALPHAKDEEFVNAPGLGVFRAKHVRRGMERGVLVEHWTGMGLCIAQPAAHGICPHCAASKSRTVCDHCACAMCSWFRQSDELATPRVSPERMQRLVARLKTFEIGGEPAPIRASALDDEP